MIDKLENSRFVVECGDSINKLKELPDNSVDSIVTDPPYGLSDHKPNDVVECLTAWLKGEEYKTTKGGFMNATWDSWVPGPELWKECYRVLKPGGHVIAFAGSRTHDLMSMAMRLAGFENRDTIVWVYGSGMPKALDVSKAIDKTLGKEREVVGKRQHPTLKDKSKLVESASGTHGGNDWTREWDITAPASEEAKQWEGWKSSLKPAFEPALLFRKPLDGNIAENVLKHGVGALNIDGCRVNVDPSDDIFAKNPNTRGGFGHADASIYGDSKGAPSYDPSAGRFPANFIHDGSDEVLELFPDSNGAGNSLPRVKVTGYGDKNTGTGKADYLGGERIPFNGGSGSAARFFYCAKASKKDRGDGNNHPTVKPHDLMKYVCRLVTPPNGIVLDPFNGSGSTGKAAVAEGFRYIGIDLSQDYVDISIKRISEQLSKGTIQHETESGIVDTNENKSQSTIMSLFDDTE